MCPVGTVYSYITVTVTEVPGTVTIAVPNHSSISKSLDSVHTIDTMLVVESSQDRPISDPQVTGVPTFINPIVAPAIQATEAPHLGTSVVYIPDTRQPFTVTIGSDTDSVTFESRSSTAVSALSSSARSFAIPSGGWNGTGTNTTYAQPASGSGATIGFGSSSTVTSITYVSTVTDVVTVTKLPSSTSYSESGYGAMVKRQTCVLISANFDGQWASWCNNWDGSTTYTYTSWATTGE